MTATRRPRGDGSVFWDASRRCWVGVLDVGRDPETGRRRRRKVSAATKTECGELLAEVRDDYRKAGTVGRRDTTVESVVRDLLANPPATWRKPSTIQVNTLLAERIIAGIGKKRLVKLTPGDVERFMGSMAREGLATKTIEGTKGIGRAAVRRAQRDGLVGRNAFELADTPRGTRRKSKAMTLEQIGKLFASDLTPWWRAYLLTGVLCGLRPGELLGLTWDDVDFAAGVVRVRHSMLDDLKTDRSRRTLQLPGKVAEALRALRAVQAADRLRLGPHYSELGLVFGDSAGRLLRRQTANYRFKKVCAAAGIGSDWHPHEQRHTFVSVLSDAGIDIEQIADAAGHKSSTVTREVYRHQIADKVSRAAAAMDKIFGTGSA